MATFAAIKDIVTTGVSSVIYSHGEMAIEEGRKCFFKCPADTVIVQYPIAKYCVSSIDSTIELLAKHKELLVEKDPLKIPDNVKLALHELLLYGPDELVPIITLTMNKSVVGDILMDIITYDNPAKPNAINTICSGITAYLQDKPLSNYVYSQDVVDQIRRESHVIGHHHVKHIIFITACTECSITVPSEGRTRSASASGDSIIAEIAAHEAAKIAQLEHIGLGSYGLVAKMPSKYSEKAETTYVQHSIPAAGGAGAAPPVAIIMGPAPALAPAPAPALSLVGRIIDTIGKMCGLRAHRIPGGSNGFPGSVIPTFFSNGMGGGARKKYRTRRNKRKARKSSRRSRH